MNIDVERIRKEAENIYDPMIKFAQKLIQRRCVYSADLSGR